MDRKSDEPLSLAAMRANSKLGEWAACVESLDETSRPQASAITEYRSETARRLPSVATCVTHVERDAR